MRMSKDSMWLELWIFQELNNMYLCYTKVINVSRSLYHLDVMILKSMKLSLSGKKNKRLDGPRIESTTYSRSRAWHARRRRQSRAWSRPPSRHARSPGTRRRPRGTRFACRSLCPRTSSRLGTWCRWRTRWRRSPRTRRRGLLRIRSPSTGPTCTPRRSSRWSCRSNRTCCSKSLAGSRSSARPWAYRRRSGLLAREPRPPSGSWQQAALVSSPYGIFRPFQLLS